jgi:hypothetical protein
MLIFFVCMCQVEENLHTKIGRLITRELDKQREYARQLKFGLTLTLHRPTFGRAARRGPGGRLYAPRDHPETHLERAHKEHHPCGRDGDPERGPDECSTCARGNCQD